MTTLAPYVASNVTDGDRPGVNTAVWLDNTYAAFPDWVAVDFGATKSVGEIDVYTRQDDVNNLVEPTATQTFSLYGVTAYDVQYWTGTAWATVPGGSITNNNLVWRKFSFTPVTTSKIRVVVNAGADNVYSRLVEVEAYGAEQQGGQGEVNWLVTDHLGTPRMVADQTGSLAGIKRHDYLPFGEEIGAGVGGRTAGQGYSGDNVRQKFTSKERDNETGLDYMQARYFASTQGRFTSCDPVTLSKTHIVNPQRWNLYVYVNNNPLALIDPDGRDPQGKDGSKTIDVFLTFTPDKLKYAGDWSKVKQTARDAGYTVVVHQPGDLTEANVKDSLANSKAVVFVGDSQGILANTTSGRFTATDIPLAGGVFITNNGVGRNMPTVGTDVVTGEPVMTTEMVSQKPQNNTTVTGIFVCGGNDIAAGINGTTVVANNGGPDGYTSLTAITDSAQKFVSVLATSNNVTTATTAAQGVLSASQARGYDTINTGTGTLRIPYNDRGDRLVTSGRSN